MTTTTSWVTTYLDPIINCFYSISPGSPDLPPMKMDYDRYRPNLSKYVCVDNIRDKPWMRGYDLQNDGVFGIDDLKAISNVPPEINPDFSCKVTQVTFLAEEVKWKIRELLAVQIPHQQRDMQAIDDIRNDALNRLDVLATDIGHPDQAAVKETRSRIVEMCLRAERALNNPDSESFSIGAYLSPHPTSATGWPLVVRNLQPAGGAARGGVIVGDYLLAIDGQFIWELSPDGTVQGLDDPKTQLSKGFDGAWESFMHLLVHRSTGELIELQIERNMLNVQYLGSNNTLPLWDGKEMAHNN